MVIIYLLLLFVVNTNCATEGDSCFKKDIPGVCTNIRVCPDAQQDVANKKHPVICDFTQEDPIVCCISSETISTTTESATTVNCILPPYPEHGTYVSNIPDGKPGEEYNSLHINVTCQEGYTIDGLDGSFFCRKGLGWWPEQIPKCKQDTPSKGLSSDQIPSFVQPSCVISETKSSDVSGSICKGQLLFEDSFKESIDKKRIWSPEIKFPAEPDFPFNVYLNEESLQVKGGILNINPITLESKYGENFVRKSLDLADRCTALGGTSDCSRVATGPQILPPIITSKITTRNNFAFKYGRVKISAKMPQGDWLIPEIQLEPRSNAYGIRNYASGLLRVATVKGNVEYGKKLYAGPIMADQEPYRSAHLKEKVGRDLWNIDFHNYTLEWRPDGISLYVDGENYGNISPGEGFYQSAVENQGKTASSWLRGTVMAPFDEMFYISLGLSVGGVNEFPDTSDKPWKNRSIKAILNFWNARDQWYSTWHDDTSALQVDYVRIYAL